MSIKALLQISFLGFIVSVVLTLALSKVSKKLSIYLSGILGVISCSLSLLSSTFTLLHNKSFSLAYQLPIPLIGKFQLVIDPLAAFFILLISLLSIPVSIYSIGYLKSEYINKNVGVLCSLFHLFILSMILVVSADNGIVFLILWEVMTLISFFFVISDTENDSSRHAGFIYLLMTHVGSAFLLISFLILAQYTNDFSFASFAQIKDVLPDKIKLLLFAFTLIGFGTKAGLIPLHIWLPEAHPQAPSHISALMSGVMIKTGIYGILRFVFDFLNPLPYWCGVLVLSVAMITTILGIIFASTQGDIKRILAYHSIENIGIILLSIGTSMIFFSYGQKELAALSLIPGLFHSLNHSIFKGLLFMGAGAVISVTHTSSIGKLGGLIKQMPKTAFMFLIGSLAISALPPFNGFISKWLTFQVVLLLFQIKLEVLKLIAPIYASLLGCVGAICIATFVKTFGGIFLGMPRSHHSTYGQETTTSMLLSMSILAFLCLILGVFPGIVFPLIKVTAFSTIGLDAESINAFDRLFVLGNLFIKIGSNNFAAFSPALVLAFLLGIACIVYIIFNKMGSKMPIRKDKTWSCGITPKAEFGYTPKSFVQPLGVIFSELHTPESFYHDHIYLPIVNGLINFSHRIRPLQSGILQIYLLYIFLALIFCLLWIRL